jgi:predicted transcriptional regulator
MVVGGLLMTDRAILTVEVAVDLKQPLESLAGSLQRSPDWIVNRALEEYLDRRLRPDHDSAAAGSTASYIELTAREGEFDFR